MNGRALALIRKTALFAVSGAVVATFGSFLGTLVMVQGLPTAGAVVGGFLAFGLLGHAWGRKPPEFWFGGAALAAAAGFLEGIARSGLGPLLSRPFHGKFGQFHGFAVALTLLAVFQLGRRAAQYRGWISGPTLLGAWLLAERFALPALARATARWAPLELAAEALGLGARAAAGGAALAVVVVLFCEEPETPPDAGADPSEPRMLRNRRH